MVTNPNMVPHGDGVHFLEEGALEFSVIWKPGEDLQNPKYPFGAMDI